MLWTLQKYIFREMGKSFLLTSVGLMAVLGLGSGVMNMLKLDGISAIQLLKVMALVFPVAGTLTLPIAALFAATVTYGRLSADNELVACRSSGINIHELFLPTMAISLASALVSFIFFNFMIPSMIRNIDEYVASDLPRLVKERLSSPERLTVDKFTLFSETSHIEAPTAEGEDVTLRLGGVAFVLMDDENWTRIGTAGNVGVSFSSTDGTPAITSDMFDLSVYDIKDGRYIDSGHESFGPYTLPETIPIKVKWLDLGELLDYQNDPASFPAVAKKIQKLQASISLVMLYRDVQRQFLDPEPPGVELEDGEMRYVIRSPELDRDPKSGRPIFVGGVEIEVYEAGEKKRTLKSDSVAMLVDRRDHKDNRARVFLQANGNVEVHDPLAPGGIVRDDRRNLSAIRVPENVMVRTRDYTDAKLLNPDLKSLDLGEEIAEERAELLARAEELSRDIIGVMHSRMAFSLSVFALVILGAALGIVFKGSQVLVAFGISFVPSLFVIIMIMMGKQMIEKFPTPTNGLILIWSGIVLVAIVDVYVMMRVVRR